jgi:hypothetical protein
MKSFPLLNRFAFCFYPLVDRETLLSREAAQGHQRPGKICLPHFSFLDLPVEPQFMVMEYLLSSNGIHSCLHSQASGITFSAVGTCSTSTSILSGSYKERLYISRMGVVDCYRNRLSWSFGRVGIAQRFRPWDS